MSNPVSLSAAEARRLALECQLLRGRTGLPRGKAGAARLVERLGYVQIDTIAVVERAHHHTFWTRVPGYAPSMIDELLSQDRAVFEYWGQAASYLPIADYRYYLPRMRRSPGADRASGWEREASEEYGPIMGEVLERIRAEGPLGTRDFKPPEGRAAGAWWDWKPAKVALELLLWRGELMVTARRNFQRIYDLTERVLPAGVDTRLPDREELGRFVVRRALQAHGLATERTVGLFLWNAERQTVSDALAAMVESGEVLAVDVAGHNGKQHFALVETVEEQGGMARRGPKLNLLSPFDSLIIRRDRLRQLFGFDYRIECYTPAAKRRYGYFTLPILWGERLVGRLDPKALRKEKTFLVRNLVLEAGAKVSDGFVRALALRIRQLARFNGCDQVKVERATPRGLVGRMRRAI